MALNQDISMWASYQNDPTKAFVGGQWVDNTDPKTQPGHGTINDKIGAYFDIGGKPQYLTWADLAKQGFGDPITVAGGTVSSEAGDFTTPNQLTRNDNMPALWDPEESFFAPFMGALKDLGPFAALTGIGGGLNALAQGGSFFGNAGGVLGDAWNGLSGGADAPWGVNKAAEGGGMEYDFGSENMFGYDAANPWSNPSMPPAIKPSLDYTVEGVLPAGIENSAGVQALHEKIINQLGPSIGPQAAKSLFSRLLSGDATSDDYARLLGTLGSTGLGVLGSMNQSSALERIANQSRTDRQPFLDYSLKTLAGGPEAYAAGPGSQALKGVLSKLSAQFGNPIGAPTALQIATDSALNNWQNAVTGFGNIGLSGQDSRNSLLSGAAGADRGVTTALASGLGNLTQPEDNSLEALLKRIHGLGLNTGTTLA